MPRYAAFLRGVTPMNAKMPEVKAAFEDAGFTEVVTVISSGNVVFEAQSRSAAAVERTAEHAVARRLGRAFRVFVLPMEDLQKILESDPYAGARVPKQAKRVVTFLRKPPGPKLELPIEQQGAHILGVEGTVAFIAYVPRPNKPVFMTLIDKTFGKDQTTRTWQTLEKVAER